MGDDELTASLRRVAAMEKGVSAVLVAHLAEFDARGLFAREGFSSSFVYCTKALGLSEQAAYKRIAAARAAQRFPDIVQRLADGRIHLSAVAILAPHLTEANCAHLLDQAARQSARAIEAIAASLAPRPDRADVVRRIAVPAPPVPSFPDALGLEAGSSARLEMPSPSGATVEPSAPAGCPAPPAVRQRVEALSPGRVHFGFTGSERLRGKLDRVRELLWHVEPAGKLEVLVERLADFYLARKDPDRKKVRKAGSLEAAGPVERTRRIPQAVKDEVWRRDGGRCAFAAPDGTRCAETAGLEFDHVIPWARGGRSDTPENIRLLCRAHNQWAAAARGLSPPS